MKAIRKDAKRVAIEKVDRNILNGEPILFTQGVEEESKARDF
jgi:hypothetical protein